MPHLVKKIAPGLTSRYIAKVTIQFLSRVSILTRDVDIAILSVHPSVRHVPVFHGNGLTYCHSFFTIILVL